MSLNSPLLETAEKHWVIWISRNGNLFGIGTEEEAKDWIRIKSIYGKFSHRIRLATKREIAEESFYKIPDLLEGKQTLSSPHATK